MATTKNTKTTAPISKILKYWIKERHNPQLGVYYVKCGQMTKTAARKFETGTLYGSNRMIPYESESKYLKAVRKLKAQ